MDTFTQVLIQLNPIRLQIIAGVLKEGKVLWAEALVIKGTKIVFVGTQQDARKYLEGSSSNSFISS